MEFYKDVLGDPKYIVAPMVDQSELAWRMLARRYGAQLCYTPMLNSKVFVVNEHYRKTNFTTNEADRPLVVQFCGNEPNMMLEAALMVQDSCDAVDVNLGCPQNIAKKGHYGAFLQDEWQKVGEIVKVLSSNLKVPVSCKIRVFEDTEKTVEYAKMIEANGCKLLTVHGRLREQRGQLTGLADWDKIKAVKKALKIPVVANGNILYFEDIQRCIDATGADGVMVAESQLNNPCLFDGMPHSVCRVASEFLQICIDHPDSCHPGAAKSHLFHMLHALLPIHTDLRERLGKPGLIYNDMLQIVTELSERIDESQETITVDDYGFKVIPVHLLQPRIRDASRRHLSHSNESNQLVKFKKAKTSHCCRTCENMASMKCSNLLCRHCCVSSGSLCESHSSQ